MIYVSEIFETEPEQFATPLQGLTYKTLKELNIPFFRVDTGEAITMEDCESIGEKLSTDIVKTLFLCNRQKTEFYIYVTRGDKPFVTKDFSATMGISRVSFGPADLMEEMLGSKIGAATVFGVIKDTENKVKVVFDKDITEQEWYGCSDGATTGYMKVKTEDVINGLLPFTNHELIVI